MPETKRYLGDGVYVDFDGDALVLTTENGVAITNRIVLEGAVYENLLLYVEHLIDRRTETAPRES